MNQRTKTILLLVANSVFLAAGILLVFFCCLIYKTWWPIFIILVFTMAVVFPITMGGCSFEESAMPSIFAGDDDGEGPATLSWIATGTLVTIAYAIPVELYRAAIIPVGGVYFSISGGTTVLIAVLIFVRVVYYGDKSRDEF
jgi:hypothetical protein